MKYRTECEYRTSKYLNKALNGTMTGETTASSDAGIEQRPDRGGGNPWHQPRREIKIGQFKVGKLGGRSATMAKIWRAALAA